MKINDGKRFFSIFLMLGFFCGILFTNVFAKDYIISSGILNDYFLNQYAQMDVNTEEYLWYIVRLRLLPLVLICALGCTNLKKIVVTVTVLWTGFSGGMLLVSAVMKMGVKGILLCLIGIFPHFLCYIAVYAIILWFFLQYPQGRWNIQKTLVCTVFMILGVLLECYINPVLMKMFLRAL